MIKAAYVWADRLDTVTDEDAGMLDQINLAFGLVRDGLLSFRPRGAFTDQLARLRSVHPQLRILLSVGGWGAGGFSEMAMTEAGRAAFAESCLSVVTQYGLDGIDVDWEYPTIDWAGIGADPRDRENFTHLLRALRAVLCSKLLTIAAGCGDYIPRAMDCAAIGEIVDYVSLMSYDMRGVGSSAGPHTALYPRTGAADDYERTSADVYVGRFASWGIPYEKQILGAAFYSRRWQGVPAGTMHGLGEKGTTADSGGFGPTYGQLRRDYIDKNGYVLYRDQGAPYLYRADTGEFISFDDPVSVAEKTAYVRKKGLAGIMYWEHTCDPTKELLTAIWRASIQ